MENVVIAARFEKVKECDQYGASVTIDVGHNPQAAEVLAENLARTTSPQDKVWAVFGMFADKDMASVAKIMNRHIDRWFVTGLPKPRGAEALELMDAMQEGGVDMGKVVTCSSVDDAIRKALKESLTEGPETVKIVGFGSFVTVTGIIESLKHDLREEQLAAGHKAAGGVDGEEHQNKDRRDGQQDLFLLLEPGGEEFRNGDGVPGHHRIAAQPPCHQKPVQVGAHRQADGGPGRIGDPAPVGYAGQPHEQPAAHVRGLGAHGRDPGPQAAPAQEVVFGALVGAPGEEQPDGHHAGHVTAHGDQGFPGIPIHNNPSIPRAFPIRASCISIIVTDFASFGKLFFSKSFKCRRRWSQPPFSHRLRQRAYHGDRRHILPAGRGLCGQAEIW